MWTVGLTGGIGSGKSTVTDCFAALGVPVIDTDAISRALTAPDGAALPAIRAAFGDTVAQSDGRLDRAALRRLVFSDSDARRRLEAILHPMIRRQVDAALAAQTAPYTLLVVPLLVETGSYRDILNRVLVVDCDEALQIERVMRRDGLARDEVQAILAAQATRAERLAAADDVIQNQDAPERPCAAVADLHRRYLVLAAA